MSSNVEIKRKKKRATVACSSCQGLHMSCEDARPCKNCMDRGIAHQCRDAETKRGRKPRYLKQDEALITPLNTTPTPPQPVVLTPPTVAAQTPVVEFDNEFQQFIANFFQPLSAFHLPSENKIPHNAKDPYLRAMLDKWSHTIQTRAPHEMQEVIDLYHHISTRIKTHTKASGTIPMEDLASRISTLIKRYSETTDKLAVPTIMWDRTGVAHYVNPAYKQVTGFPYTLPTDRNELAVYTDIFSPDTFKDFLKRGLLLMRNYPEMESNSFIFTASVKLHTMTGNKYIAGTMSVNCKNDEMGFPFYFIGNFLPFDSPRQELNVGPL